MSHHIVERILAKLKASLRKAAARTVDSLDAAIVAALTTIEPDKCSRYFANAGYLTRKRDLL